MRILAGLLCLLLGAPLLAGPRVVVSVLPLAGVVDAVSCGRAEVYVLIPPGASPATWVPTLRDREAVQNADLVVRVLHPGLAFERRWLGDLLADRQDLAVVDAAAGLRLEPGDPHVWASPENLGHMAGAVAAALDAPAGAAGNGCLARYQAELAAADATLRTQLAGLAGRRFYVLHPAWGYFARDYGLIQVAIEREGKEPGPARLAALIEAARADGVRVVFVQPQFPDASARMVADALGARVVSVDPLARNILASMMLLASRLVGDAP